MPPNFSQLLDKNLGDLGFILPEIVVAVTFLVALLVDFALPPERRKTTAYIAIVGILIAALLTARQLPDFAAHMMKKQEIIYSGMLVYDAYGAFFKLIILLGTAISILLAVHARELFGKNQGEFFLLLLAVGLGGMFLSSASNLLMIYLSLESLSIVSYAMAGYLRRDRKSAEAGIKYVIYGAMASGIMLFGMSYLYGLGGTLNLFDQTVVDPVTRQSSVVTGLAHRLMELESAHPHSRGAVLAVLVMVFSGFLYKIAAVPFHYWSPDVYEGAPTTATGFFSVVPKAAGFAVLIRMLCAFFPLGVHNGSSLFNYLSAEKVLMVLAVVTMIVGNLAALGQTNAKRMLAYSSIAHAGYMLAGLSVLGNRDGPAAVLFYMVVYLFMNLGAFIALVALENTFGGSDLKQLRGAVRREPVLVVSLCIFLFSLTGLPPLGGFIGKYLIMWRLADNGNYGLIFWIGLNSVISLYYYMKLAKAVAIDEPEQLNISAEKAPVSYNFLVLFKSAMLLLLFFYFEPIRKLCAAVMEPLLLRR